MKLKVRICTLLVALISFGCTSKRDFDEAILGKWMMSQVFEYDNDVTEKHNPKNNRWIEFKADGTFVSDGDPFGKNTGRWSIDGGKQILIIDSDVDDDDSEWQVVFNNDNEMSWTGIGHPRKQNTVLIHVRTSN